MTKTAMVSEMVKLGVIAEKDRNYVLKKTKDEIERIYKTAVPKRKAFLKKA